MIINTYSKNSQTQYGAVFTASTRAYFGIAADVTLEDILACCQEILAFLKKQGFRRVRPTNQEIWDQNKQILNELRDMKKEVRRRKIPGGYDGTPN